MHSLITQHEESILTGLLDETFSAFSREITVWKEPIKIALSNPAITPNTTFGFGDDPVQIQYSYIPVSGNFPSVIRYKGFRNIGEAEVLQDTNTFNPIGEVTIKVRQDCFNYIESGKTSKFTFDARDWYFAGKYQTNPFLGSLYYIYQLKPLQ